MKYSIINNKQRETDEADAKPLWRRINILDVIFVIVILLMALSIVSFFTPLSFFGLGGEQKIISYTVEINDVDGSMADSLVIGDKAFDAGGKNEIGVITIVKVSDTLRYIYDSETGGLKASAYPPDSNGNVPKTLRITIQATADYNAGKGYSVGGNRISVGSPMTLCFTGFTGSGNCISVYVIGNANGVS